MWEHQEHCSLQFSCFLQASWNVGNVPDTNQHNTLLISWGVYSAIDLLQSLEIGQNQKFVHASKWVNHSKRC